MSSKVELMFLEPSASVMFGSSVCPPAFVNVISKTMAKTCQGKGGLCTRKPASMKREVLEEMFHLECIRGWVEA